MCKKHQPLTLPSTEDLMYDGWAVTIPETDALVLQGTSAWWAAWRCATSVILCNPAALGHGILLACCSDAASAEELARDITNRAGRFLDDHSLYLLLRSRPELLIQTEQQAGKIAALISFVCKHRMQISKMSNEEIWQQVCVEDTVVCPICCEDLNLGKAVMRCCGKGGCRQYFHLDCGEHWMKAAQDLGQSPSCPVCRSPWQAQEEADPMEAWFDEIKRTHWKHMSLAEKTRFAASSVVHALYKPGLARPSPTRSSTR